MASIKTPICDFGWQAPNFSLKGVDGKIYSLENICGKNGTVIMFICNHCPYVKAILDRLVRDIKELQKIGIGAIAIMSNDPTDYPEDSFENMKVISNVNNFSFPYVIDPTQEIAKAYGAVCTPDFFGLDKNNCLQYRGRLDASNKEPGPSNARRELFEAMTEIAKSGNGPVNQISSIGCSIKWIAENS